MKNTIVGNHRAIAVVSALAPIVPPMDQSLVGQVPFHSPGHWANRQKRKEKCE